MKEKKTKLLEMKDIKKVFYGHTVLNEVSFELDYGVVLGLVGQNGAGKSTLMKILTGAYQHDGGSMFIEGKEKKFDSIQDANANGIALVFQELSLAPNMTVADNIFVGNLPTGRLDMVKKKELYQKTDELIKQFGVDIKADDKIGELTVGKRQIVEIIKAISKNPKILILDEPTSSLEKPEIEVLFQFIRKLKSEGYSIIYISHHMSEIFDIVDDIMILRDGNKIMECKKEELSVGQLISMMIGKEFTSYKREASHKERAKETVLSVQGLSDGKNYQDVSFDIRKGEIIGIAGIVGCGKTELCESIYGMRKTTGGQVLLKGQEVKLESPNRVKDAGILLLPENRKTQGLFLNDTIKNNMMASVLPKMCNYSFLNEHRINEMVEKYQKDLKIKMNSPKQIIRFLSGGNQQKVLVAKCISDEPTVLIAMDPTRGIDVSSKEDIHKLLHALAEQGLSVLVVSSELEELINLCDRIHVMNAGCIAETFERVAFDENDIMLSMHRKVKQTG